MKRWVVAIFGKEAANCIFAEIEANQTKNLSYILTGDAIIVGQNGYR